MTTTLLTGSEKFARAFFGYCSKATKELCPEWYGSAIKRKKRIPLNVIGPQIRRLRLQKGWTQDRLAAQLQLLGWDTSRESVNRLENQYRRVADLELFALARILAVRTDDLFPKDTRKKLRELGPEYRIKLSRGQVPP